MPKVERLDSKQIISSFFATERNARSLAGQLAAKPTSTVLTALRTAFEKACSLQDTEEQGLRLVCLTRLLRGAQHPGAIDLLIDIMGSDIEEARMTAGLAIEGFSMDDGDEVSKGIRRAIERLPSGHQAMRELPFLIEQMEIVDAFELLRPFLSLQDPAAVGAAIEAYIHQANPNAIPLLEPLTQDTRVIESFEDIDDGMDEDEDEDEDDDEDGEPTTVGSLAIKAIESLKEMQKMMEHMMSDPEGMTCHSCCKHVEKLPS